MNQTTTPSLPPSGHEFTQGNIIFLFLALFICLITQPSGSLLYSPLDDSKWPRLVRILFSLWRFHPLACIAEAVAILICYADTLLRVRRRFLGRQRKPTWSDITHALHNTSIALFLIRGNDDLDGDIEAVLEQQLASLPLAGGTPTGTESSTQTEKELETDELLASEASDNNGRPTREYEKPEPDSSSNIQEKADTDVDSSSTRNLRRRGTSQLEAGKSPDDEDISSSSKSSHLHPFEVETLELFLTRNTPNLIQRSRFLDITTTIIALFITILLLTTSFALPFRLAAAFLLLGWYAVQSLHLIFRHRPLSSSFIPEIISRAKRTRHILAQRIAHFLLHLFTFPFLFYISYYIVLAFFIPDTKNSQSPGIDRNTTWWKPPTLPGVTIPGGLWTPIPPHQPLTEICFWFRLIIILPVFLPIFILGYALGLSIFFILPTSASYIVFRKGIEDSTRIVWFPVGILQIVALIRFVPVEQLNLATDFMSVFVLVLATSAVLWFAAAMPYGFRTPIPGHANDLIPGPVTAVFWVYLSTAIWIYVLEFAVEYYDGTGSLKPRWLEY